MEILVLGGTGAMGRELVKVLAENGNRVTVTSRRKRDSSEENVCCVQGNAKAPDFLAELISEKQYGAIVDFMVYSTEEFRERVDLFLDTADQYVFISSARVYADSERPLTEGSPRLLDVCGDEAYLSTDEYALAKARQEDQLLHSGRRNWTVVRPSLTYNENRLQLGVYEKENWLYRALHGRPIVFSRDLLDKYYTLSYGADVSKGIAALIGNTKANGEVFHVVVDKAYKWGEILEIYLDVLECHTGKRPQVVLTESCTNLRLPGAIYQVIYGRYFNRRFDNAKIKSFVDTSSWMEAEQGLQKCLKAFLEHPQFLSINWMTEAYIDKAAHTKTPLKEIPSARDKLIYFCYRHRLELVCDILRIIKKVMKKGRVCGMNNTKIRGGGGYK